MGPVWKLVACLPSVHVYMPAIAKALHLAFHATPSLLSLVLLVLLVQGPSHGLAP